MPLSKDDRILFSSKIISAELEILGIQTSQSSILAEKQKVQKLDESNKKLEQNVTAIINPYQIELGRYTGVFRTELTQAIINDSGASVLGNFLFPNDLNNPPPSLTPMPKVWPHTKPYARNVLVGKQYDENYPASVPAEQSKLNNILSIINDIETNYTLIQRVTGQKCTTTTNPDPPPPTIDTIEDDATLHALLTSLINAVNDVFSYVTVTQGLIFVSDPNPTRAAEASTAVSNINLLKNAITTWLTYPNFDTSHTATTCPIFNSYNINLLAETKLKTTPLNNLKNAILNRISQIPTRISQINGYLGNITQNLSTGECTGNGLYFERYNFLLLRLNRVGGTLFSLNGFNASLNAQESLKNQINLAKNTYQGLLKCSILAAPTNGTDVIHVKEPQGFNVGDTVFLVSNNQEEMVLKITSIQGTKIRVGQDIPPKYRPNEGARLYKDLT